MSTETTLTLLPPVEDLPAAYASDEALSAIIERIEKEVRAEHFTVATPSGRKRIGSVAYQIKRSKTTLDEAGEKAKSDAQKIVMAIDAKRRGMRTRLDALAIEVREPLDQWERAETARVKTIKGRIAAFFGPRALPTNSADLIALRDDTLLIELDENFEEFVQEAAKAKDEFLRHLASKITDAQLDERRRRELAEQREREAAEKAAAEARAAAAEREAAALRAQLAAMQKAQTAEEAKAVPQPEAPREAAPEAAQETPQAEPETRAAPPPEEPPTGDRAFFLGMNDARAAIYAILRQINTRDAMAQAVAEAIWNNEIPYVGVVK
jgi:hypothetical protein